MGAGDTWARVKVGRAERMVPDAVVAHDRAGASDRVGEVTGRGDATGWGTSGMAQGLAVG